MISALGAQVFAQPACFSLYFGFALGDVRDSPNARLALVSLYVVDFLSLLATVLLQGSIPSGPAYLSPRNPAKEFSAVLRFLCLDFFRFPRTGSTKICLEAGSRTARQFACCYAKADVNVLSVLKKA